jgi:hypothetical protein
MSVQPPRGLGRVRVLEIEGVDLQPCGGTHVANTADDRPRGRHEDREEERDSTQVLPSKRASCSRSIG